MTWNYTKYLSNTTNLQLAVTIYNKYNATCLENNADELRNIWITYFPKSPCQPSAELASFYMTIRSMQFGNFQHCPKGMNKYEWFIQQHRDSDMAELLNPLQPSFVPKPIEITIDYKNGTELLNRYLVSVHH